MMTRANFLFKLMAAFGVGQAAHKLGTTTAIGVQKDPANALCLKEVPGISKGSIALEWTKNCYADCAEGESRCPIGHCQKPQVVKLKQVYEMATVGDPPFELHVCSVCGVVYVQKESK